MFIFYLHANQKIMAFLRKKTILKLKIIEFYIRMLHHPCTFLAQDILSKCNI